MLSQLLFQRRLRGRRQRFKKDGQPLAEIAQRLLRQGWKFQDFCQRIEQADQGVFRQRFASQQMAVQRLQDFQNRIRLISRDPARDRDRQRPPRGVTASTATAACAAAIGVLTERMGISIAISVMFGLGHRAKSVRYAG